MARKKGKKKIKVRLELPKDDNTETNFTIILMISMMLGMSCLGFWITNADLVFKPMNQMPMFLNLACPDSFDPNVPVTPTYADNESCFLTKESPSVETWTEEWDKVGSPGAAAFFVVPGIEQQRLGSLPHPPQFVKVDCLAEADNSGTFTLSIIERSYDMRNTTVLYSEGEVSNSEDCGIPNVAVQANTQYEIWVEVPPDQPPIRNFQFTVSVDAYDGIPENMNNKSLWIGPEVPLGPFSLYPTIFVNFFGIGLLIMVFPAALYSDAQARKIKAIEDKFPDFLRDLAEYWKGGLSMVVSVRTLASSEYGALNNDIQKMSDQLSWGIPFGDVMRLFAGRVNTPLVHRAVSLIDEANKAGGKISDILVTAANDSREIKFLEGERVRAIASYISVIWVSYLVFMGVIVVLSKVFIPAIASSNSGGESESIGNMQINAVDPLFFLVVFFYGVSAQAVGNGAMAGLMATGRLANGMKHSGYMLMLALFAFNFVAFSPDLIGVPMAEGLVHSIGRVAPG
ncbi:MAG TPA: type II secretion system F family protein [Candidatus Thalassarchaeaceae archaeon]|nr:type II secretion system F family protein [Candidatus Thalassarchaeaceae archaeon]